MFSPKSRIQPALEVWSYGLPAGLASFPVPFQLTDAMFAAVYSLAENLN